MTLKCLGSSSAGNCYLLTSDSGETLILDCGIPIKEIKKGLNWNIKDVVGVLCTHQHSDHNKSLKDFINMGTPVFAPYLSLESMKMETEFNIRMFDLTTIDVKWTHTHADGTPCPIFGFLTTHTEMGRMLYVTDTNLIKWKFKGINHILLGTNYDKDLVNVDNQSKANHVFRGHLSIDTACEFVKSNNSNDLQNVIMCHLSSENADSDSFIEKMKKVAKNANVDVAVAGKSWYLKNPSECPF